MRRIVSSIMLCVIVSSMLLGPTTNTNNPISAISNKPAVTDNKDTIVMEDVGGSRVEDVTRVQDPSGSGIRTKITNWPAKQVMYGTNLRSLNNKYNYAMYKPKFSDVSFLQDRVKAGLNIPAIETSTFDSTKQTVSEYMGSWDLGETRETNILGKDILAVVDEWDTNAEKPKIQAYNKQDSVRRALAITACSKALGALKYNIHYETSSYSGDLLLPITKTPFVTMVSSNDINVNTSKYYTDIYISRTSSKDYWDTAKRNGIVSSDYDSNLETSTAECWDSIKLGELAIYIKAFLYLNGEPVMTDEEEEYLLSVYGRTLPTYLPSDQLIAIKYLMARGIISSADDFKSELSCGQLMTYLMRAKDASSRLTFKTLTVDYDKSLVKSGYYPTEVTSTNADMLNPKWTSNVTGSDYFDYFVSVNANTKFRDSKSRTIDTLYVSSVYDSNSASKYEGSRYLGIENNFYHFQVPNTISTDSNACKNGYITISSGLDSSTPVNLKVQYGGGRFTKFIADTSKNCYKADRIPFTYEDKGIYIDIANKEIAMSEMDNKLYLAKKNEVTYSFQTENIGSFRWDGKAIPEDGTAINGCTYNKSNKTVTVVFDKKDTNSDKAIKQRLTVDSTSGAVMFPAYMNADDTILVSKSFIDKYLGECSLTAMDKSPGVWLLRLEYESIIIDTNNKRITSGQCIEELDKDDKSPLVLKYSDGECLIDYRCLKGVINDHLVLDDTKSGVKAISASLRSEADTSYVPFTDVDIQPLLGDNTYTQARITSTGIMSLEACYNKANFLLYKKTTGSTKYTTLIVFKPKVKGIETQDNVKAVLKKDFNIELGENENCTLYYLTDNDTKLEGDKDGVYRPLNVGNAIQYSNVDGYTYKIPDIKTWDFTTYYDVNANSITSVLPIVKYDNMYIDVNANVSLSSGPYKFPNQMLNAGVASKLGVQNGIAFSESTSGGYSPADVSTTADNNSIQYAPVGLFLKYYNVETNKGTDILDKPVLYGTMAGKIVKTTKVIGGSSYYYFKSGSIEVPITGTEDYYLLNFGNFTKSILYVYKDDKASKVGNFADSKSGSNALSEFLMSLVDKNIFDWGNFNLLRTFQNIDNVLTLIFIFLLNIVPRIMIMDFLILATLSFVARYPLIIFLCNKVVDFYKLLSCFQLDVNTIEVERIWMSTFWATVILGMLQQESLIHLLTWVDEWVFVLLSR